MESQEQTRGQGGLTPLGVVIEHLLGKSTSPPSKSELEQYECAICRDAHYVHPRREDGKVDYSRVVPCQCARERLERDKLQRMFQSCELPSETEHMTFDTFKVLPGLEEAYEAALAVAEGRSAWLTLMSDTDRGKTHLLIAICRHWVSQGKPARYAYVPLLLEELRRGFRHEGDWSYESRFDFFLNVPLLALDDLGTESRTPWANEKLDILIDYRLVHGLALVVTTNLTPEELNFRIASRLRRRGRVVFIDAPEYRTRPDRRAN